MIFLIEKFNQENIAKVNSFLVFISSFIKIIWIYTFCRKTKISKLMTDLSVPISDETISLDDNNSNSVVNDSKYFYLAFTMTNMSMM
jgi:hypothetical protein